MTATFWRGDRRIQHVLILIFSWLDHWLMILWWDPVCQLFLFQRDFADIPPCHNGYNSGLVVTELLGFEFTGISGSEANEDPKGALCQGPGVWPKAAARCWWTRRGLRAPRRSSKTQETLLRHKISLANSPERENRRISWWKQPFQWVAKPFSPFIFVNVNFCAVWDLRNCANPTLENIVRWQYSRGALRIK